jgi:2-amino-4-hydroxy-6-hydroxymethyldihydropteridine diphosphokinase
VRTVALLLGSNVDPGRHVPLALADLEVLGTVRARSGAWRSPPAGGAVGPDFWNLAVLLQTPLDADALRVALRAIETRHGRVRPAPPLAPRTIDIDVVGENGSAAAAEVKRWAHVAVPLAEIAPAWVDDERGEPVGEIAGRLRAETGIVRLPDPLPTSSRRPGR